MCGSAPRIILRIGCDFSEADVTGRLDEFAKLTVRHRRAIHPEGVDRDAINRCFLGVMTVRSHAESAAGSKEHVCMLLLSLRRSGRLSTTHNDLDTGQISSASLIKIIAWD